MEEKLNMGFDYNIVIKTLTLIAVKWLKRDEFLLYTQHLQFLNFNSLLFEHKVSVTTLYAHAFRIHIIFVYCF